MPCEVLERLKSEYKGAQEEWAYFAYPQNKTLRGTSDRKSKELAKEAQGKMNEASRRMALHRQSCEACMPPGAV